MTLVTGGAGFVGSHVVDRLADGTETRVLDLLHPTRMTGCRPISTPTRNTSGPICAIRRPSPTPWRSGRDQSPGLQGRPRCRLRRRRWRTWTQRRRHGGPAEGMHRIVLPRVARARLQHGRVRRWPLPLRARRHRAPGPRGAERPREGQFEPRARHCHATLQAEETPGTPPILAMSTRQRSCTRSTQRGVRAGARRLTVTALRYHNVYGPGCPRYPYAGVASIFRSALERGGHRVSSRMAASAATSSMCRDVARRTLHPRVPPTMSGPLQHRESRAAHGGRDGGGADGRRSAGR